MSDNSNKLQIKKEAVKIDGTSLVRDMNSKCLKETNPQKAKEYQLKRLKLKEKFDEKDARIEKLEQEMAEMKAAINSLLISNLKIG